MYKKEILVRTNGRIRQDQGKFIKKHKIKTGLSEGEQLRIGLDLFINSLKKSK